MRLNDMLLTLLEEGVNKLPEEYRYKTTVRSLSGSEFVFRDSVAVNIRMDGIYFLIVFSKQHHVNIFYEKNLVEFESVIQ